MNLTSTRSAPSASAEHPQNENRRPDCIDAGPILAAIETRLAESHIAPSRFGREAMGNPRLVFDLRKGRWITPKTEARLTRFLDATEACHG